MASFSSSLSVDQLLCSICQDVFDDPATIPCGHNFCMECITQHWNSSVGSHCPLCQKNFHLRPDLGINREFRDIIEKLRGESPAQPEDILCDACVKIRRGAVKSCVQCGGHFCKIHLEPHNTVTKLKTHKLIDPVANIEDYICQSHDRPLELFCRYDQTCVCVSCPKGDHRNHNILSVEEESNKRKPELKRKQAEFHLTIQQRREKTEEIKNSVKRSREKIEEEKADCEVYFTALIDSINSCKSELLDLLEKQQKTAEEQAEKLIKELEQEICELNRRNAELEQLLHTEDHVHLLQICPSLCSPLESRNWSEISISTRLNVNILRKALEKHQESLKCVIFLITEIELKKIKEKFTVNVTMNPQTAHPQLLLSENNKQVRYGESRQDVPDTPWRFDICPSVLGNEGFSSGRFYFEVQVEGKTEWDIGVARVSVNRRGTIKLSPENGFWTLWLRNGYEYKACDTHSVPLSLRDKPQRVGVYVDYEEGLVSFYNVESNFHIYSFIGQSFSEILFPYFSPGFNNNDINLLATHLSVP